MGGGVHLSRILLLAFSFWLAFGIPHPSITNQTNEAGSSLSSTFAQHIQNPTSDQGQNGDPDPPELENSDWFQQIQEQIQAEEYHITWAEHTVLPDLPAGYQAPNRAQNLRTYFTPHGIVIIPRTGYDSQPPWRFDLVLVGWGKTGAFQPALPANPAVQTNRIEYAHREGITEWYQNDESGLEQGWR